MSKKALTRIWALLSIFLLGYVLNVWIYLQGGENAFDAPLLSRNRAGVILIALVVAPVVHGLANVIGIIYAAHYGSRWPDRIPLLLLDSIDSKHVVARAFQAIVFLVFALLPLGAYVHFLQELSQLADTLYCRPVSGGDFRATASGLWSLNDLHSINDPCRLGYGLQVDGKASNGVTFFPLVQPAINLVLVTIATALTGLLSWSVAKGNLKSASGRDNRVSERPTK